MARYIDADALEHVISNAGIDINNYNSKDFQSYINGARQFKFQTEKEIRKAPTVDVAPKSEVAREIFAEIIESVFSKIPHTVMLINNERDFSDGVIFGKQEALFDVINELVKRQKKYIGG